MAKTKSTYVPSKLISRARFDAPDRSQRLTIELREGKNKFNIKASLKDLTDTQAKASTGARDHFDSPDKGEKAFQALVKTAKDRGWNALTDTRSAFDDLPEAPGKGKSHTSNARVAHSK